MKTAIASICFDRPELHEQSLESLAACRGSKEATVVVFCDAEGRCAAGLNALRERWGRRSSSPFSEFSIVPRPVRFGLSANILLAYDSLFDLGYDRVILLEEDIIVSHDFLAFHEAADRLYGVDKKVFAVIGYQQGVHPVPKGVRPESAIVVQPWFASNGCAISRIVWERVCRDRVLAYLRDPLLETKNLQAYIPPASWRRLMQVGPKQYVRIPIQDMFLNCIRAAEGMTSIWPVLSRTQHIGYYGLHMPQKTVGESDPRDPKNWESTPHHTKLFRADYCWESLEMLGR